MWGKLSATIQKFSVNVRIILNDGTETEWSRWLTFPTNGYGEIERYGPFKIKDVKYVELNPIVKKKVGKLLPEKTFNHTVELSSTLTSAGISYEKHGDIIRVTCFKKT